MDLALAHQKGGLYIMQCSGVVEGATPIACDIVKPTF
jgi:hypothetical protein